VICFGLTADRRVSFFFFSWREEDAGAARADEVAASCNSRTASLGGTPDTKPGRAGTLLAVVAKTGMGVRFCTIRIISAHPLIGGNSQKAEAMAGK